MSEEIRFLRDPKSFQVHQYDIHAAYTNGHHVRIYAECSKNDEFCKEKADYYILELYYSVYDYETRSHLIGVFFGEDEMSKWQIDKEMDAFVRSQVSQPQFVEMIEAYLERETLWENEMQGKM